MRKVIISIAIFMSIILLAACSSGHVRKKLKDTQQDIHKKPNIIYFLVDDMGYGDLSCYGQKKFTTPNLDKMAKEGMKFTQYYCGTAVCAPSRSSLLTGTHTGHTYIRGNKELRNAQGDPIEGQAPLTAENVTIAEVLKTAGYATGCFGKWGLGVPGSEGDPMSQGFDEFMGPNCQRMAHSYYPPYIWHNDSKSYLKGNDWSHTVTYSADVIQDAALKFIDRNKDKPFFAYMSCTLPHAELMVPNDSIWKKFDGKFAKYEKPYKGCPYGPNSKKITNFGSNFGPQKQPFATYAAMIYRIDVYVGQIMAELKQLGIADNTIIMFSSDNGPHNKGGEKPSFFKSYGPFRGIKFDLYEGGIRTDFIVKWPDKIKPGTVSDHIGAFWDVMPTIADITGVKLKNKTDGISFLPTLLGNKADQKEHDHLYWELNIVGGRIAARWGDWKGVVYKVEKDKNPTFELYNLSNDIGEKHNVATDHPEIVDRLKEIMIKEHAPSKLFPFDISSLKN